MRIPFLLFLVLLISKQSFTQDSLSNPCNLFQGLKYKNGIAKLEIRAITNEMGKLADDDILRKLEKKGKLRAKDFGYAIVFRPLGCEKTFYISSKDKSPEVFSLYKSGEGEERHIKITCTVYENYKLWDYPFFVVVKIVIE